MQITPITTPAPQSMTATTQTPSMKAAAVQQALNSASTQEIPKAEVAKEEIVPRETKPEPSEQDKRFAALSRREKEILRRDRDLKERERQLSEKYKPWEEASQVATQSKVQALQKLGISYDDVVAEQLGISNLTPEQIAERKALEIYETKFKEYEAKQQQLQVEQQQNAYTQALAQITSEVKQACDPEKFPLVNNFKGFDTVTALIEQTYHQTGEILSREEGLAQYEQFLEEQLGTLLKDQKIRTKLVKDEQQIQPTQAPTAQTPTKTLTHKTTTAPTNPEAKPKTWEEKKQYLIQKYQLA